MNLLLISSVLQGGVATGLSHVETVKSPKLFIVKGKRQPVIRQLPTISWKEFNDGDVFVLDTMTHIFVWIGKNANRLERLQASKVKHWLLFQTQPLFVRLYAFHVSTADI